MQDQPTEFSKLIACWQAMPRAAGKVPYKSAFKPAKLFSLMPYLFLVEREDSGYLIARIVGSELEERLPYSPSNSSVFETMMSESWDFYEQFIDRCSQQVCAGHLTRCVVSPDGYVRTIESLQLPLADIEGCPRFMLGVMIMREQDRWDRKMPAEVQFPTIEKQKSSGLSYNFIDIGCGIPAPEPESFVFPAGKNVNVKLSSQPASKDCL